MSKFLLNQLSKYSAVLSKIHSSKLFFQRFADWVSYFFRSIVSPISYGHDPFFRRLVILFRSLLDDECSIQPVGPLCTHVAVVPKCSFRLSLDLVFSYKKSYKFNR